MIGAVDAVLVRQLPHVRQGGAHGVARGTPRAQPQVVPEVPHLPRVCSRSSRPRHSSQRSLESANSHRALAARR